MYVYSPLFKIHIYSLEKKYQLPVAVGFTFYFYFLV